MLSRHPFLSLVAKWMSSVCSREVVRLRLFNPNSISPLVRLITIRGIYMLSWASTLGSSSLIW